MSLTRHPQTGLSEEANRVDLENERWQLRMAGLFDWLRVQGLKFRKDEESLVRMGIAADDARTRSAVARALCVSETPEARSFLEASLINDSNSSVRADAAMSLGFRKSRESEPVLEKGLEDEADVVVASSIKALVSIQANSAATAIVDAVLHRGSALQLTAVKAVAKMNGKESEDSLEKLAKSRDPNVRRRAVREISRRDPTKALEIIEFLGADEPLANRAAFSRIRRDSDPNG